MRRGATLDGPATTEQGGDAPVEPRRQWRIAAYAVCRRGDELLVVRASERTEVAGSWFLPGGGLEYGEDPADAVLRELGEETGLSGTAPRLLDVVSDVRRRRSGARIFTVRLIYVIDDVTGELAHEAHGTSDEARWVPLDELDSIELMPYARRAIQLAAEK